MRHPSSRPGIRSPNRTMPSAQPERSRDQLTSGKSGGLYLVVPALTTGQDTADLRAVGLALAAIAASETNLAATATQQSTGS